MNISKLPKIYKDNHSVIDILRSIIVFFSSSFLQIIFSRKILKIFNIDVGKKIK